MQINDDSELSALEREALEKLNLDEDEKYAPCSSYRLQ